MRLLQIFSKFGQQKKEICRSDYYESYIRNIDKESESPKVWWKEIKRIGGMSSNSNVINQIIIEALDNISEYELANTINKAFLEPLTGRISFVIAIKTC